MRARVGSVLVALLAGCSGGLRGDEPLGDAEVRVIATFDGDQPAIVALPPTAPFSLDLRGPFERGQDVEVWVFGYTVDALVAAYPTLAGMDATQIAAMINPTFAAGRTAPQANAVLRTVLRDGASGTVPYEQLAWSEWLRVVGANDKPAFFLRPVAEPEDRCASVRVERVDGPVDEEVAKLVVLDDDTALAVGPAAPGRFRDPMTIVRVDGLRGTMLSSNIGFNRRPSSVAWDGEHLIVVASEQVRRVDINGVLGPDIDVGGARFYGVTLDASGQGYLFGRSGFYELSPDKSTVRARDDFRSDFDPTHGVTPRADRLYLADDLNMHAYDGVGWKIERPLSNLSMISDLNGDDDVIVGVGSFEFVTVRDPNTGRWDDLPHPIDSGHHLRQVAPLGGGDFILVGDRGSMAAWLDGAWCAIDTGTRAGFHAIRAAPSGRVAYAGLEDGDAGQDGSPFGMLRVTIPPR